MHEKMVPANSKSWAKPLSGGPPGLMGRIQRQKLVKDTLGLRLSKKRDGHAILGLVDQNHNMNRFVYPKSLLPIPMNTELTALLVHECRNCKHNVQFELVSVSPTRLHPFYQVSGLMNLKNALTPTDWHRRALKLFALEYADGEDIDERTVKLLELFPGAVLEYTETGEEQYPIKNGVPTMVVVDPPVRCTAENLEAEIDSQLRAVQKYDSPYCEGWVMHCLWKTGDYRNSLQLQGETNKYYHTSLYKIKCVRQCVGTCIGLFRKITKHRISSNKEHASTTTVHAIVCFKTANGTEMTMDTIPLSPVMATKLHERLIPDNEVGLLLHEIDWYVNTKIPEPRFIVCVQVFEKQNPFSNPTRTQQNIFAFETPQTRTNKESSKSEQGAARVQAGVMEAAVDKARKRVHKQADRYDHRTGKQVGPLKRARQDAASADLCAYLGTCVPKYLESVPDNPEMIRLGIKEQLEKQAAHLAQEEREKGMPSWWQNVHQGRSQQHEQLASIINRCLNQRTVPDFTYTHPHLRKQFSQVAQKIDFDWKLYPTLADFEDTPENLIKEDRRRSAHNERLMTHDALLKTNAKIARELDKKAKHDIWLTSAEGVTWKERYDKEKANEAATALEKTRVKEAKQTAKAATALEKIRVKEAKQTAKAAIVLEKTRVKEAKQPAKATIARKQEVAPKKSQSKTTARKEAKEIARKKEQAFYRCETCDKPWAGTSDNGMCTCNATAAPAPAQPLVEALSAEMQAALKWLES